MPRVSTRPRHWGRAQAEKLLTRFIPFSSLVSPVDVITRGGGLLVVLPFALVVAARKQRPLQGDARGSRTLQRSNERVCSVAMARHTRCESSWDATAVAS